VDEKFEGHFYDEDSEYPEDPERAKDPDGFGDVGEAEQDPEQAARVRAEAILQEARTRRGEMLTEADRMSAETVENARREAAAHLESARGQALQEAEDIAAQARREGHEEGRAQGQAEYDQLIAEAEDIRAQAEAEYRQLLEGAEADVVSLVMEVAKKVVGEEMTLNRQNLLVLVKDALQRCSNKEQVVLKVSAGDYDYIRANRDVLLSLAEGVGRLEIKKDLSLGAGACFVETPFGNIDAGIVTKLSKVEDAFYRVLGRNANDYEN
jgi:flagellar assembly protein FliH